MTSTRERQRAAARARLEKEMAKRAASAKKRRQFQAWIGAGAGLILVIACTTWLVVTLGDDDSSEPGETAAGTTQCAWTEIPAGQGGEQVKDVGLPPVEAKNTGTQTMTIDTNLGPITAKLNLADVPCTAASFTHLASNNFLDNTKCHRLVTEGLQVLQCGDPSASGEGYRETDGTGGPSYRFAEENLPTEDLPPYPDGVIAMANSGQPGTTGSQFFIVFGDSQLDASYTVLGTITEGMEVVKQVGAAGHDDAFAQQAGGGHPKQEVVITKLTMSEPQS